MKNTGVVLLLFCAAAASRAQPVPDRILDAVEQHGCGREILVIASLTIPVRHRSHFPADRGRELRVRLLPVDISPDERDALFRREMLVPDKQMCSPLNEVIYEGDIEGGPYLTFLFDRSVHFSVEQGRDSRSIVVRITVPEPLSPGDSVH